MKRRQNAAAKRDRPHGNRWLGIAVLLSAVYIGFLLLSQQVQIQAMTVMRDDLRVELTQLETRLDTLVETRELLAGDEYVEMMAREQLGLVKEGEIPYTVTERRD